MIKKIFKESFLYTFANNAPLLVNIFILPVITPFLTSQDYGIYGLVFAYTAALSALSNLGFIALFQNSFFKEENTYKEKWGKYFGILIIWKIIYAFIVLSFLFFAFYSKVDSFHLLLILSLVGIPILMFDLTKTIGLRHCQYTNNHKKVYTITFITSIFSIITTFVGVYYYDLGYVAWLISAFISSFIQFIYFFIYLNFKNGIKPQFNFSKKELKENLKFALPLIPHEFSGYLIDTSDRLILDSYNVPIASIGQYNLAYSFANYFKSFNNAMNTVLSPIYYKLFARNEKDTSEVIKNITSLWFYFILFVGFILSLWLKEIFEFLYRNKELSESYYLGIFIIMGFVYQPFYVASVDRAIFYGKSKSILKISLVAGLLNLILNLVFIPYYGILATVLSTFICYVYMGFSGFFIKEIKQYIKEKYPIILFFSIIIILPVGIYLIRDISIAFKISISIFSLSLMCCFWYFSGKKMYQSIKHINS